MSCKTHDVILAGGGGVCDGAGLLADRENSAQQRLWWSDHFQHLGGCLQ